MLQDGKQRVMTENLFCDDSIFVIAEMSGNHNKSLNRALAIVDAAADSGVNAIKLQTFKPSTMILDINTDLFTINNDSSPWYGRKLYDLYSEAYLPWEWHKDIFEYAHSRGLICFSTPFDACAVDFLEELGAPLYKVASHECIDLPLISRVAQTKKPIILSTGMATIAEISEAVEVARDNGCSDITLLKCTTSYPASAAQCNINTIPHLAKLFQCRVGLSDHTLGIGVAIAAVAVGARVIEKHLTLSRSDGGVDSVFSLEPKEMKSLVTEASQALESLGQIQYGPTESELQSRKRRRSLFISKDLSAGEILDSDNLSSVRPGYGLAPKFYETLIGKRVNRDLKAGTPVTWDLLG